MKKIYAGPGRYIQNCGEIKNLYDDVKSYGSKFIIICGNTVMKKYKTKITASFDANNAQYLIVPFRGECSLNEINRIVKKVSTEKCDCVIGIGGGKVLDTAKAVAHFSGDIPKIIVPTIASNDAPVSALSVIYTDEGVFDQLLILERNPEMVIVDSKVIACAGSRYLKAGIGDALATYFEAKTCIRCNRPNFVGGKFTLASWEIAKLSYKIILENGKKAILAVDSNQVTEAVEQVIEANVLLSGIGFESNGTTAAHSFGEGFTVIPKHEEYMHGEFIAFGTLAMLILENYPNEDIDQVVRFCHSIGLPTTFKQIGLESYTDKDLTAIAQKAIAGPATIYNEPFEITIDKVKSALMVADEIGTLYKNGESII